jgi:hypothetical protein
MLVVTPNVLEAEVLSNTLHEKTAWRIDIMLDYFEIDADIYIDSLHGENCSFIAHFNGVSYWNNEEESETTAGTLALAVGHTTQDVTWGTDMMIAVFEDYIVLMSATDCRALVNLSSAGASDEIVGDFYFGRSYRIDRNQTIW